MRVLLLLVALAVLFAVVGWVTFSRDDGRASINIETEEIRRDTGEVMHEGAELLEKAEEEVSPEEESREPVTTHPAR